MSSLDDVMCANLRMMGSTWWNRCSTDDLCFDPCLYTLVADGLFASPWNCSVGSLRVGLDTVTSLSLSPASISSLSLLSPPLLPALTVARECCSAGSHILAKANGVAMIRISMWMLMVAASCHRRVGVNRPRISDFYVVSTATTCRNNVEC